MSLNVDTDAVLLIDAENAFNFINRRAMSHNLIFICFIIASYIINCYATPLRLYIVSEGGIPISYESICIRHFTITLPI